MLFKNLITKMQQGSRNFIANCLTHAKAETSHADYENSIKALNGLQSNAAYIKVARKEQLSHPEEFAKTILQMQKYLIRSGISLETLDTLPVIHIAGTKGKGTTCALCESILRHHGIRTGFYSSPHLLEVRERIRINGAPLKKQEFAKHFWHVYNKLEKEKSHPSDMPMYFMFLTIMAFRVFLIEQVDVAIIEVGIGGEYDSTNVLRKVPLVGITSLGLDHTNILGDTIEKIAWHKAGIMKQDCRAFTIPQSTEVMRVLQDRSIERKCSLETIEPSLCFPNVKHGPTNIFKLNGSLAITLAETWMNLYAKTKIKSEGTKQGLLQCSWPGRYQILHFSNTYYLDGAHTPESIQVCAEWFSNETQKSSHKRVLIFNATGDRNSECLLNILRCCCFDNIYFVPNKACPHDAEDNKNFNIMEDQQLARCYSHRDVWFKLEHVNNTFPKAKVVKVLPSVLDALLECDSEKYDVLITGSLHLIGAALSIIDVKNGDSNGN